MFGIMSRGKKWKLLAVATLALTFLAMAVTAAADGPPVVDPPAVVQEVPETPFPVCLTPTPLAFLATGGGAYSAHLVFQPIMDPSIQPHGQMENSRFDVTWAGDLLLGLDVVPDGNCQFVVPLVALARASGQVSGQMMLHLNRPLPNDPFELTIPGMDPVPVPFPVTPYSVSIVLDEPVEVLPGI